MRKSWLVLVSALLFVVACGGADSDTGGVNRSALTTPGLTPVPCGPSGYLWNGTKVELLVADAIAACARGSADEVFQTRDFPMADKAFRSVITHMEEVVGPVDYPLDFWIAWRGIQNNNCDPANLTVHRAVTIDAGHQVHETMLSFGLPNVGYYWSFYLADADLRWAGTNLCVAQRLRDLAPGSAGAEALLMSDSEQRELLETIRERTQIAMLQYALLGSVFASHGDGAAPPPYAPSADPLCSQQPPGPECDVNFRKDYRVQLLQYFGHHAPVAILDQMGKDFAAAVQLDVTVSEEILELLARSRSAETPRGGQSVSRAEEVWGKGSWQQRLMVGAFGGDPLVADSSTPWKHPTAQTTPAVGTDWPARNEFPYVRVDNEEPEVGAVLALAKNLDVIELALVPGSGCRTIDPIASATPVHDALELKLRELLCLDYDPNTGSCSNVSLPQNQQDEALWKYYRITPVHVATAVRLIAELIGPEIDTGDGSACPVMRFGSHDIVGALNLVDDHVQVSAASLFAPRTLRTYAGAFTQYSGERYANAFDINPDAPSNQQGFSTDYICLMSHGVCVKLPGNAAAEAQRTMGVLPALAATRELVLFAQERLQAGDSESARLNDYFAQSDGIVRVTSGAIGDDVTFTPQQVYSADTGTLSVPLASPGRPLWNITVTSTNNDPFWQPPASGEFVVALGVPNDGWAANLANFPKSQIFGRSLANVLYTAVLNGHWTFMANAGTTANGVTRVITPSGMQLRDGATTWTFLAWKGTVQQLLDTVFPAGGTPVFEGSIRTLAAGLHLKVLDVTDAQYVAASGRFGAWLGPQETPDQYNPAEPAFDAFALPRSWVPPGSAEILGGAAGDPSYKYYLDAAAKASDDAKDAIDKAIQGLLDEENDEAKLQAETALSLASIKESAQKLCGYDNSSCNVKTSVSFVKSDWFPAMNQLPAFPSDLTCSSALADPHFGGDDMILRANTLLQCTEKVAVQSLLSTQFTLADPVAPTLTLDAAPSFADYSGGDLQAAFVEQWRAVKAANERIDLLAKQVSAASQSFNAAKALVAQKKLIKSHNCGVDDMALSMADGAYKGAIAGATIGTFIEPGGGTAAGAIIGAGVGAIYGFASGGGGLQAQIERCQEVTASLSVAVQDEMKSVTDGLAGVSAASVGLANDRAAIVQSGVKIEQLTNQAKLEQEKYALEATLFGQQQTSFGLYRRYRSYDAWRAKALLDNARRYALAARRGIEARYVVDLSRLTQDEAFVASPSTWANEVYEYDLSLPAAVGLNVGQGVAGGIYANKVSDYVANLSSFVSGFAVTRPSAVASEDLDVVYLKGFAPLEEVSVDDGQGGTTILHPNFGTWQVQCPPGSSAANQWVAAPPPDAGGVELACVDFTTCPCASDDAACVKQAQCPTPRPIAARLVFALDPWARVDQGAFSEPYTSRYNARWTSLAVNLIGTGIHDCEKAADKQACYAQGYLSFNLRQVGRAWVTDYAGQWRAQGVPPGLIEGGKALAAELWLDPLKDGWDTSYIKPVARSEYYWRPFGGAYQLDLKAGPEVRLERLERVQLLVGSSYWVKQQ